MRPLVMDDPILRENQRSALARRLISHRVRTQTISQLTGMTRNRLATVRRRLMVHNDSRRRGPPPSSLDIFLHSPQARAEGAALAALCFSFEIPIERGSSSRAQSLTSLDYGERLCEIYEAFREAHPRTEVEFEEFLLLKNSLVRGDVIRLGKCRSCRCLVLVDWFGGGRDICCQCGGG